MKTIMFFVLVLILSSCSASTNQQDVPDIMEGNVSIFSEESFDEEKISAVTEQVELSEKNEFSAGEDKDSSKADFENETGEKELPEENQADSHSASESNKAEPTFDIDDYTANYYQKLSGFDISEFYKTNSILDGKTVDFDAAVIPYSLYEKYGILRNKSEFDAFISDYKRTGKIRDMYYAQNYYITTANDETGDCGVTLIPEDGSYRVGQIGGTPRHIMPHDAKLFEKISAIYNPDNMEARCVVLTRYLGGILLTDGAKEHFIVLDSTWDFADILKVNSIYAVSDVVKAIEDLEHIVVDNNG